MQSLNAPTGLIMPTQDLQSLYVSSNLMELPNQVLQPLNAPTQDSQYRYSQEREIADYVRWTQLIPQNIFDKWDRFIECQDSFEQVPVQIPESHPIKNISEKIIERISEYINENDPAEDNKMIVLNNNSIVSTNGSLYFTIGMSVLTVREFIDAAIIAQRSLVPGMYIDFHHFFHNQLRGTQKIEIAISLNEVAALNNYNFTRITLASLIKKHFANSDINIIC